METRRVLAADEIKSSRHIAFFCSARIGANSAAFAPPACASRMASSISVIATPARSIIAAVRA
jgi:hypothetical protein